MWYIVAALVAAGVLYALAQYYREVVVLYSELVAEGEKEGGVTKTKAAVSLMPPGWRLLPLLPFWGKTILEEVVEDSRRASRLRFQEVKSAHFYGTVSPLGGGEYVLLFEQYDMYQGGRVVGMRMEVLDKEIALVSGNVDLPGGAKTLHVATARPLDRVWAVLKPRGKHVLLQRPVGYGRRPGGIVTVMHSEPVYGDGIEVVPPRGRAELRSGDRILVGMGEYWLIRLPHLALCGGDGVLSCVLGGDSSCVLECGEGEGRVELRHTKGTCFTVSASTDDVEVGHLSIASGDMEAKLLSKDDTVCFQPADKVWVGRCEWVVRYAFGGLGEVDDGPC